MVSDVGGSLGPVKILNLAKTGFTHSLITILKYWKGISHMEPFKAHFQRVHFHIVPNFGSKMWKRAAVRLFLKLILICQKLHICIYFLNLLVKAVQMLFSELKNKFFLFIFLLKTSQEGHFLLIFHVNEVAPILSTHFDAT